LKNEFDGLETTCKEWEQRYNRLEEETRQNNEKSSVICNNTIETTNEVGEEDGDNENETYNQDCSDSHTRRHSSVEISDLEAALVQQIRENEEMNLRLQRVYDHLSRTTEKLTGRDKHKLRRVQSTEINHLKKKQVPPLHLALSTPSPTAPKLFAMEDTHLPNSNDIHKCSYLSKSASHGCHHHSDNVTTIVRREVTSSLSLPLQQIPPPPLPSLTSPLSSPPPPSPPPSLPPPPTLPPPPFPLIPPPPPPSLSPYTPRLVKQRSDIGPTSITVFRKKK